MTSGVIWKQLLNFSIPMAIGLLFQQLYNTVDTIVVGNFVGTEALAAVGSVGPIMNMLVGLCAGLATGAGVVISQAFGAHDYKRLHDAVHTSVSVTFIMSVLATLIGLFLTDPMLRLMETPENVFAASHEYLTIYFSGVTGLLVYNMGSGILRAVGNSRSPLIFLCISAFLNIVFDLMFVLLFGMGVDGVAYATILSQVISALLILYTLTRTAEPYRIEWGKLCIKKEALKKIVSIGLPSGIQQAVTSFSNVFVQSYINFYGSDCMAGWATYNKIDGYVLIPVQSIALASTTFVGQNFGAHELDRAKKGVKQALLMSLGITIVLSFGIIPLARNLLELFVKDKEKNAAVIDYGVRFITLVSPFYLTICFNQIFAGALRGVGKSVEPTVIMLFSFVVFRQIYLFVNKMWLGNSFFLVSIAYPVGWALCSILMTFAYKRSILGKKDLAV